MCTRVSSCSSAASLRVGACEESAIAKPVTDFTTFGSNTTGTTTQLDNNFLTLKNAVNDFNTYKNYLVDTGAANAYVVALPANITGLIEDGLQIQVKLTNPNSGASVLNYNSTGNANIVNMDGSALGANQIAANMIGILQYSNAISAWMLQTPLAGNNSIATANQMIAATSNTVVMPPGRDYLLPYQPKAHFILANLSGTIAVTTVFSVLGNMTMGRTAAGNYNMNWTTPLSNVSVDMTGEQNSGGVLIFPNTACGSTNANTSMRLLAVDTNNTLTDPNKLFVRIYGTT